MSIQGRTNSSILRSLKHMEPPRKGSKFYPRVGTHALHRPKFVQPKDRFPYWNIVPGDHVKVRNSFVRQIDGNTKEKVQAEGIVTSVDRQKNWLYLRDIDDKIKLVPKLIRHAVPRYIDPQDPSKGYIPNVTAVPRPVHYSKVILKVPGTNQFAKRLSRSSVRFNKVKDRFEWKRFAIIKASEEMVKNTGKLYEKVEVPWPRVSVKPKKLTPEMSDFHVVEAETWTPWRPEDPVWLMPPRAHTSIEAIMRNKLLVQQKELEKLNRKSNPSSAPEDAEGAYVGFKARKSKPPPIVQPPTPAEMLRANNKSAAVWSNGTAIQNHQRDGGLTFMYQDYLDIAPLSGPANGGDWSDLPSTTTPESGLDSPRDPHTGRLLHGVTKNDLDRMPIELLMKNDLVNMHGLKWKMRRWKFAQEGKKAKQLRDDRARKELHKELQVLKL